MAEDLLEESMRFSGTSENKPFFPLYTIHQSHVPRVPNERFAGATRLGPRGDVIMEFDWYVGELLSHVEKNDAHRPVVSLRGGKYSKFGGVHGFRFSRTGREQSAHRYRMR